MPHTIRKNDREWQRLWRGGDIITRPTATTRGCPGALRARYGARPAPRSSRPDVNGPQGADPMTGTGRLTGATVRLDLDPAGCYGTSSSPGLDLSPWLRSLAVREAERSIHRSFPTLDLMC